MLAIIIRTITDTIGYIHIVKIIVEMTKIASTNMHVALSQSINSFFILVLLFRLVNLIVF